MRGAGVQIPLHAVVTGVLMDGGVGCAVVRGASANARSSWRSDDHARVGRSPEDTADPFAGALTPVTSDNAVGERFQGGPCCAIGFDRQVTT